MAVDPLTGVLGQLPKAALIVVIGNPYTYTFHVGVEILRRFYLNYSWHIVVSDVIQRYKDTLRQYGVVKDDIAFLNELGSGVHVLEDVLRSGGNLAYVVINNNSSYINDYCKVLMRRDPSVGSVAIIQVDEEFYKPIAYIADLIIRLGLVEDPHSLKTISRTMKLVLMRGNVVETLLGYDVLPNEIVFRESTRI